VAFQGWNTGSIPVLAALDPFVRVVPTRAGLRPGPHRLRIQDAGRGPPIAAARQAEAGVEDGKRAVEHAQPHPAVQAAADRLPRRAGAREQRPGRAGPAQPPQRLELVRVDHSRGRPVLAGGSIASMVVARRTVAFARTVSLMAGA
jgi:hypothetical protein